MSKASDPFDHADNVTAFRLVGQFMQCWGFLEGSINDSVRRLLGLGVVEGTVLTANMGVRDKLQTLKTLLNMFSIGPEEEAVATGIMNRLGNLNDDRNTVAHNVFWAHKSGGVEFSVIKARGNLQFPTVIWSEKQFAEKRTAMNQLTEDLKRTVERASEARLQWRIRESEAQMQTNIFANALTGEPRPTTGPLSRANSPTRPPRKQKGAAAKTKTAAREDGRS